MAQDPSMQKVDEALRRLNASLASFNIKDKSMLQNDSDQEDEIAKVEEEPRMFRPRMDLKSTEFYPDIKNEQLRIKLNTLHELQSWLKDWPYSMELYMEIARAYVELGYPDLAVGAAYKALLLVDAATDESDEYYEDAYDTVLETIQRQPVPLRKSMIQYHPKIKERFNPYTLPLDEEGYRILPEVQDDEIEVWIKEWYTPTVYGVLVQCLHVCGCERSAYRYCQLGLELIPDDKALLATSNVIAAAVDQHFSKTRGKRQPGEDKIGPEDWPDEGMVRRERYPWSMHEPDRCSKETVDFLNAELAKVAPKLQVRVTELPNLSTEPRAAPTIKQLGIFAKEDIAPGTVVLEETSLLTANNRLQDALCDACSADLPDLATIISGSTTVVSCPDCQTVFCSQRCADLATTTYHPALCDQDVETIAKDVPPAEAANALYLLLLLRSIAMSETQSRHPLDLDAVKYIWGDYHTVPLDLAWRSHSRTSPTSTMDAFPRTLPFSFQHNVVLPFHMLTKMDVNIFTEHARYDVWVFNTLYAKFRGTASARLSGLGGRPVRGPEVSAVHPMWCLANHSCDPNVSWEWGGSIRFWTREQRVEWVRIEGGGEKRRVGEQGVANRTWSGLKKGEEVLNHYCDVELGVQARREWAAGSLGGACQCSRCVWESGEVED